MTQFAFQSQGTFLKVPAPSAATPYVVAGIAWDGAVTNRPGCGQETRLLLQKGRAIPGGLPIQRQVTQPGVCLTRTHRRTVAPEIVRGGAQCGVVGFADFHQADEVADDRTQRIALRLTQAVVTRSLTRAIRIEADMSRQRAKLRVETIG